VKRRDEKRRSTSALARLLFLFSDHTHSSEASSSVGRRVSSEDLVQPVGSVLDGTSISPSGGRNTSEFRRWGLVLEPSAYSGRSCEGRSCSWTEVVESEVGGDRGAEEEERSRKEGRVRGREGERAKEEATRAHQSIS